MNRLHYGLAGLLIVPLAALLSSAATSTSTNHATAPSQELPTQEPDPKAAAERLSVTNASLRRLANKVAELEALGTAAHADARPPEPTSAGEEITPAPDVDEQTAKQFALLDESLASGTKDRWADKQESVLLETLQALGTGRPNVGAKLDRVECRATLCRARLLALPGTDQSALVPLLSQDLKWPGEIAFRVTPGEHPEATLYLGREGTSLPRIALAENLGVD